MLIDQALLTDSKAAAKVTAFFTEIIHSRRSSSYVLFQGRRRRHVLLLLPLLLLIGREAGQGRRQASCTSAGGHHHHHEQQQQHHHHHHHQGLAKKGKTLTAEEVARISICEAFITGKSKRKLAVVLAMGTPPYTPYLHIIFMSCLQVSPSSPGCTVTTRKLNPRRILLTTTLP